MERITGMAVVDVLRDECESVSATAGSSVIIKSAEPSDHSLLLDLLSELANYYVSLRPVFPSGWRRSSALDRHQRQLEQLWASPNDHHGFVAFDQTTLAGFCRAQWTPEGPASASIHSLCVRDTYRKRGIGKALMTEAISWCRSVGAVDVSLDVLPANTNAARFHDSLGFEPFISSWVKQLS